MNVGLYTSMKHSNASIFPAWSQVYHAKLPNQREGKDMNNSQQLLIN